MTGSPPAAPWPPVAVRRAGFERMYAESPGRFSGPPSRFSGWALEILRPAIPHGTLLDLGCGLGRDARRFAAAGYSVIATDYSETAIARARKDPENPAGLRFESMDAVTALRSVATGTLEAVYAHAVYMMLPDAELEAVFRETRRALRAGGLHLFAVRSVTDPAAREGVEVAPDVRRRGAEDAAPYRYFRRESIDRWTATGFERVAAEFLPEIHFWFVADRRP